MAASFIRTGLRLLQHPNQSKPIIAAAATRSFSSSDAAAAASSADQHWSAQYRRRLGIGDSPVVIRGKKKWEPPIPGVVKINYTTGGWTGEKKDGSCMEDKKTGEKVEYFGLFHAFARNALGGILGYTVGHVPNFRQKDRMGLHLYALRGMGNLIRELREQGIYDGPFVIESNKDFEEITKCLGVEDRCCNAAKGEALLRASMPQDLEVVDAKSTIHVGDPDEMMTLLEGYSNALEGSEATLSSPTKSLPSLHFPPTKPLTRAAAAGYYRSTSTSTSASAGEHWTARYRRRLGIVYSPVVIRTKEEWEPPKAGELKINYATYVAFGQAGDGDGTGNTRVSFNDCVEDPTYAIVKDYLYKNRSEDVIAVCSFEALAHNSSGKPIGIIVGGWMAYRDQMGVHLYALRGAGRLAKALRDGGFHDGPVVYESENKHFFEISKCLNNLCDEDEGELERVLQTSMPWDVEDVDAECKIHTGDPEEVMKVIQSMAAGAAGAADA